MLSDVMVLEGDEAETFPLRVSCLRLNILFGRERRASSFIDLFAREDKQEMRRVIRAVIDGMMPAVAGLTAAPAGQSAASLEVILLPLSNGDGNPRLLCGIAPVVMRSWFGRSEVACLRLSSSRFLHQSEVFPQTTPLARAVQSVDDNRLLLSAFFGLSPLPVSFRDSGARRGPSGQIVPFSREFVGAGHDKRGNK